MKGGGHIMEDRNDNHLEWAVGDGGSGGNHAINF